MTNSVLWTPLAFALLAALAPRRLTGAIATLGSLATLGLAIALAVDYDAGAGGLQHVTDFAWISELGIHYRIGIDELSVYLVLMTAILWAGSTLFCALREWENARLYFFMLGLAETAAIGAFVANDLILFVLFFDAMLIPFYFLVGVWGTGDRIAATTRMIIYTLVGSLLMLVGAIATGLLTEGHAVSFSLADLGNGQLAKGSQQWIFWFFAAAFLIKMPAFLVHGWMPAAYRSAPLPVLALLSGVLSKVAAYGFLRIVLPLYPQAASQYQEVLLLIAVASILYGSVMAFTQTNARLIAGYSSIAQLGFITLGIFSFAPGGEGVRAAVLQMVNHGLVVAPVFLIIAILYERSGTDDIAEMGGLAKRAPILAALFLVVTMATLAIPGSANFIGEFYILLAAFKTKIVYAIVASVGVALAAFYALRLYQRTMHNPEMLDGASRELSLREALPLVPLVACIVAIALYPKVVFNAFGDQPRGEARAEIEAPR